MFYCDVLWDALKDRWIDRYSGNWSEMWIRSPRFILLIFGIILLEDLNRKIMGVENLI